MCISRNSTEQSISTSSSDVPGNRQRKEDSIENRRFKRKQHRKQTWCQDQPNNLAASGSGWSRFRAQFDLGYLKLAPHSRSSRPGSKGGAVRQVRLLYRGTSTRGGSDRSPNHPDG